MQLWVTWATIALVAYLLGSTPTGYLAGRLLRGIDIREHGSKSTGATNVLRTLGKWPALLVLLVDLAKGAAAVILARWLYAWFLSDPTISAPQLLGMENLEAWSVLVAGVAVLLGHGRSVWLNFTGGKSAATGLGVLLAMTPVMGLVVALVWTAVLAVTRVVSLSSILAACAGIVLAVGLGLPFPYLLLLIAGGGYVIVRHATNIQRLLNGTEPRLGQKAS
jgi:acyl phosphate:glycerol-3-phosphate acyltransferase